MKVIRVLELGIGVMIPLLTLAAVISLRTPFWDWLFGLDTVEKAAARFEKSYGDDASIPVRPGDPAWEPLLKLIRWYSFVELPTDREPKVIARSVAVASAKTALGAGRIAQWTAPTTPLWLIYREWPGQEAPLKDALIVGTIGDLHKWVDQFREYVRFWVQDASLLVLTAMLSLVLWLRQQTSARDRHRT